LHQLVYPDLHFFQKKFRKIPRNPAMKKIPAGYQGPFGSDLQKWDSMILIRSCEMLKVSLTISFLMV